MDGQYGLASQEELWRVFEALNKLQAGQLEQAERIGKLERRRNEDYKLKSLWDPPVSPLPVPPGVSTLTDPVFHSPPDAFKGFDQGHHPLGKANSNTMLDTDEEPRRGASRANSVRFDESAIHGDYGQNGRSSTDLPLRTGSGMGSLPLSERSLSHRSDARLSSSGHSHHSARTNSLRLDTSLRLDAGRGLDSSFSVSSPLSPPPGLFLLGPVPCIIRCWLTTTFSHDTLLYAAICSGSYVSIVSSALIRKLGMEESVIEVEGKKYVKAPVHITEASVHQASSRSASPEPQVPALTIRFLVREMDASADTIGIIIGSDVLQSHGADILFSKNRVVMRDDDHNLISIPLVRPEQESVFKGLRTVPDELHHKQPISSPVDIKSDVGVIGPPPNAPTKPNGQPASAPASTRGPIHDEENVKPQSGVQSPTSTESPATIEPPNGAKPKPGTFQRAGAWAPGQRSKLNAAAPPYKAPARPMKVLRPMKHSNRTAAPPIPTGPAFNGPPPTGQSARYAAALANSPPFQRASNPVGDASAFPWLGSSTGASAGNSK